ncbi:MAG TPA: hypothetical protein VK654_05320 [Nitrospirota bacterium]|nr:hypothetical protein [Nitrospirota bacterium]
MKASFNNLNKRVAFLLLLFFFTVAAAAALYSAQPRIVPMRVCLVLNPRFDAITDARFEDILKRTGEICLKHFKIKLQYVKTDRCDIAGYFAPHINSLKTDKDVLSNRLAPDRRSIEKLAASLVSQNLAASREMILQAVKNQEGVELLNLDDSKDGILRQVAALHLRKLIQIKNLRCADNKPLLKDDLYNEFTSWDYISEHQNDYDLVITNQPIISAESYFPTIHSSMRGGITSGLGGRSPSKIGGMITVSTFPMTSTFDYFVQARGINYDDGTQIETIAMIAGHELGHVLKYWDHVYDHPGCIMRPTPGLKYAEWVDEINRNGPCRRRHAEALKDYFSSMRLK